MTNEIVFTLQVDFARSDRHGFNYNFASISCGLRLSELFGCFMAASSLNRNEDTEDDYLQTKQRTCRDTQGVRYL